jgi:hypothetical protein
VRHRAVLSPRGGRVKSGRPIQGAACRAPLVVMPARREAWPGATGRWRCAGEAGSAMTRLSSWRRCSG